MKKYDVCGLGNALVDLLFEVNDEKFSSLNLQKGTMRLIDVITQTQVLNTLGHPVRMASGGSVANSVAMMAQLGGKSSLLCSIGDDDYGQFFTKDLAQLGVEIGASSIVSKNSETGTSLVVVTPDAERTMSTCLAESAQLSERHVRKDLIEDSYWLFIEGYLIANSESARLAITKAVDLAKQSGTKVALTLSDGFVVNSFRPFIDELLPKLDFIFANELEAAALCGEVKPNLAFEKLRTSFPGLAVTAGSEGAFISFNGQVGHVPAYACNPVDLTGAGDAFAGAFLQALTCSNSPIESAKKGCFYAGKVVQQWGARLGADMAGLQAEFLQN